jgi:hypothetical protein
MLRVSSHVPQIALGGKTREENSTLLGEAGKLGVLRRAEWWVGEAGRDPWVGGKAGRWLGEKGGAMVRAGLRAWGEGQMGKVEGRKVGVIGVVERGSWPKWLDGMSPKDVAENWRERSPLWLLEKLPNLAAAQLAVEIGARGPVETVREKKGVREDVERRIQRWGRRGAEWVVLICITKKGAAAEVWGLEKKK